MGRTPSTLESYGQHPDVTAIVHMHPLHASVLGALLSELRPLTCEGCFLASPLMMKLDQASELIIAPEMGTAAAYEHVNHTALFLVDHGIVTVGATKRPV
jgi:ribulose-5-phosphate 4-epimerase/fuculose-1-phosphate aldolase